MAAINRVMLVGRLTRDPELRHIPSGTAVLELRPRREQPPAGRHGEVGRQAQLLRRQGLGANQAESCAQYLCRRAAGSASTDASTGARGRHRTAPSARRSTSWPDTSSSSTAAATARAAATSPPTRQRPLPATSPRRRPTTTSRSRRPMAAKTQPRKAGRRPGDRRPAQELPLLQGQGRGGGLQERQPAAALHLGEGQDPQPADHRCLPPPPAAGRGRGQAGPRDGAAAVRRRGSDAGHPDAATSRSSA